MIKFSSVQSLSHVRLFATPWTTACQASLSIPNTHSSPSPCPLSRWCHSTISFSVIPFSSCPQSFPASGSFLMSQLFALGGQSVGVSASASVLPMNTQDWSPLEWTVGSPCSPRDSQESSPTPQFKRINSLALSHLYGPTLTFIGDYWKNHSFDKMNLSLQSNGSAFWYAVYVGHSFYSKDQLSFNFMTAVTLCSDFGAQENKDSHCFHCFPIYLPWSAGTRCHSHSFLNAE